MTDEQYTLEAQRHLAALMERQKRVASDVFSAASKDAEPDARGLEANTYEDVKEGARRYAQAINSGARIRTYPQDTESQREGVRSALDWLSRKKKSAIR